MYCLTYISKLALVTPKFGKKKQIQLATTKILKKEYLKKESKIYFSTSLTSTVLLPSAQGP